MRKATAASGGAGVVGRVHDAEDAQRDVEGVVDEGQRRGIALDPGNPGVARGEREQCGLQVHPDDLCGAAAARGG